MQSKWLDQIAKSGSYYTAAFLSKEDRENLLKTFLPSFPNIYADHLTIKFKPSPEELSGLAIGKEVELKIIGIAKDRNAEALLVDTDISSNEYPHITLSTSNGIKPVYSNELFDIVKVEPVKPIKVNARIGIAVGKDVFFSESGSGVNKIVIPVRLQTDTIIAIFLLKTFGKEAFPGIELAECVSMSNLPEGESEETLAGKGMLLIDIGKGKFDHHNKEEKITSSDLVARFLGVIDDPSIAKLLEVARRCDFYGKGTISDDALDRAFGLSGLISSYNKVYPEAVGRAVEVFLPIIEAHYKEEVRRTKDMPLEVEEKMKNGKAETFEVKQRDKKLKVIIIESDNPSLPGFLRAHIGGSYDVVAQVRETGHINILTRPAKRIDLRALVALVRAEELMISGSKEDFDMSFLSKAGRIDAIPEWYYDPATNSVQNGGINPAKTAVTKIPRFSLKKILEVGLSEQIWSPMRR